MRWIALIALASLGCGVKFNDSPVDNPMTGGAAGSPAGSGGATGGTMSVGGNGGGGMTPTVSACLPADGFEGEDFHPMWSAYGDSTAMGEATFTLAADSVDYHGINSTQTHDVRGCAVWLRTVTLPNAGATADAFLQYVLDQDNYVGVVLVLGLIEFRVETDASEVVVFSDTFDPVEHRWWRLREDGGNVFFDTAPDGRTWTEHAGTPAPEYVDETTVGLGGCSWLEHDSPGLVEYDDFNTEVPSMQ